MMDVLEIRKVAVTLEQNLNRAGDFVARYGGEEFPVVLPETNRQGPMVVAENMRKSIEAMRVSHHYLSVAPVFIVSAGVTTVSPGSEVPVEKLVDAAGQQLYRAMNAGRNRVVGAAGS